MIAFAQQLPLLLHLTPHGEVTQRPPQLAELLIFSDPAVMIPSQVTACVPLALPH